MAQALQCVSRGQEERGARQEVEVESARIVIDPVEHPHAQQRVQRKYGRSQCKREREYRGACKATEPIICRKRKYDCPPELCIRDLLQRVQPGEELEFFIPHCPSGE